MQMQCCLQALVCGVAAAAFEVQQRASAAAAVAAPELRQVVITTNCLAA
jgi:hypothetical protein